MLKKDEQIYRATTSYIIDILVDEKIASTQRLLEHLKKFGLVTKQPEPLEGGAALGLRLKVVNGDLMFYRGNQLPMLPDITARWELFSICGKLTGRMACSFVKRQAQGSRWEDFAAEDAVYMLQDVLE